MSGFRQDLLPISNQILNYFTRRSGLLVARTPNQEFQHHWREVHAPMAALLPGLRRYVQSQTRRSAYAGGRAPAYDGVALAWFDSAEAARRAAASSEYARVVADTTLFLAPVAAPAILTTEHVIVG